MCGTMKNLNTHIYDKICNNTIDRYNEPIVYYQHQIKNKESSNEQKYAVLLYRQSSRDD